ncbi:MAG TPA: substrate-binding domain-containing protein, partial [Verrucomicrobiae bacterium]|nr:substrate-binding domain-containing protein [Verrucomicrobiae bacterium]
MKAPFARIAWTFASVMLLAGCGGKESPPAAGNSSPPAPAAPAAKNKGMIGVSVLTLTNPFFKEIADSITAEAAKQGYTTAVVSGEFDVARQQNQVKDFIVKKAVAIVLTPCDSKSIGPAIQEATAAGIPVFTADIACLAPGAKVVAHVATDNYGGGKEAGKAMIEALGGNGGKIAILHHAMVESCIQRVKGFREVIDQYNTGKSVGKIEIVS